ncbi:hypothetical protein Raf01_98560 [Rugosimonospora africana]|uniref:Uncharacterized protein n=1 Tax=Rugosimonospora africana TaxID=556532 RepID=A0A8J3VXB2_9ACTN|nr:hypothetical protein Raf01_98560 [Rugosimonospora africana]
MLAVPAETLPSDPDWAFEPRWRAIAFHDVRGVRLYSRAGRSPSGHFPDITRLVPASMPAGVIFDELIIWDGDRTNLALRSMVSTNVELRDGAMQAPEHRARKWCTKRRRFQIAQVDTPTISVRRSEVTKSLVPQAKLCRVQCSIKIK